MHAMHSASLITSAHQQHRLIIRELSCHQRSAVATRVKWQVAQRTQHWNLVKLKRTKDHQVLMILDVSAEQP